MNKYLKYALIGKVVLSTTLAGYCLYQHENSQKQRISQLEERTDYYLDQQVDLEKRLIELEDRINTLYYSRKICQK